jgi:D-arabinose 1-dehydrogenase-like Zn-dependent alcohol dehydrogenase
MPTAPPRTAKAAVYEAPNAPFVVREFPLRRVRCGEVLVRVTMSTICRSDIHSYQGWRPNPCPGVLGHEIVGVIEEIDEGVDRDMRGDPLKIGDRIEECFDELLSYTQEHQHAMVRGTIPAHAPQPAIRRADYR